MLGTVKRENPLSPDAAHFQATCRCRSCFLAANKLWCNIFFLPAFKKVFAWCSVTSVVWIKMQAFAYSLLLALNQRISLFDLLFIWLSPCTSRLFILHFNIWWGHLWSVECGRWVTLVDKNIFLSFVPLFLFQDFDNFLVCHILCILKGYVEAWIWKG